MESSLTEEFGKKLKIKNDIKNNKDGSEDEEDKEQEYSVVGTTEADPFAGKISNESPLGAAILGKKVNTVVTVRTPTGEHEYKILKVK